MGRQINYIMDYCHFLELAQTALDAGCLIVRKEFTKEPQLPSGDISSVTQDQCRYWFYLPELADMTYTTTNNGLYHPDYRYGPLGLAMIEAGFSKHPSDPARLYIMIGYYDDDGQWTPCTDQLIKIYEKLARKARKIAVRIM